MEFTTDDDLLEYVPDLGDFGITDFSEEHARAGGDILRQLRADWWVTTGYSGELDSSLLTSSQFIRLSVFRVLGWYVFPKLTKWGSEDRFEKQMRHYRAEYADEFHAIILDGVEYDANADEVVSNTERRPRQTKRLVR